MVVHSSAEDGASIPGGAVSAERVIASDLWGEGGAALYRTIMDALHAFAQATGCPPGGSVVKWYDGQVDRWDDACRAHHAALKADANSLPVDPAGYAEGVNQNPVEGE